MQSGGQYKGLVFILDGLGDRPCESLNARTPLEAARTPTLDALTERGQCGLMHPLVAGLPVDTHTGTAILFGMPPKVARRLSRGPIEAAGIGVETQVGDVLLRCNFAAIEARADDGFKILDRRAGRIDGETRELCEALRDLEPIRDVCADVFPATQHRAVLRLRSRKPAQLSAEISDTDPGGAQIARGVLQSAARNADDDRAKHTAGALNEFIRMAFEILDQHPINTERRQKNLPPANGMITRSAGLDTQSSNLPRALGLKTAVVAAEDTILGLAKLFGFTAITDASFTSLPDTNLAGKLSAAEKALHDHDLVYVHLKGTDTAAHDRNPELKRDFIQRFDVELAKFLRFDEIRGAFDNKGCIIALCADHSTDCTRGEHNGDPVPVILYNPAGRRDAVTEFGESACRAGGLAQLSAQGFMLSVLDAVGALGNYGALDPALLES